MDWTALTAAVSFADAGTFIGAVALALAGVYVIKRGAGLGLAMLRGK